MLAAVTGSAPAWRTALGELPVVRGGRWAVGGSASLALHGLPVDPRDLDLLADHVAAAELVDGLRGAVVSDEARWDRGDVRVSASSRSTRRSRWERTECHRPPSPGRPWPGTRRSDPTRPPRRRESRRRSRYRPPPARLATARSPPPGRRRPGGHCPFQAWRFLQRNVRNAARTSSVKSCGCSQAAKWPPLSTWL
jgi:hypothetical protein